MDQTGSAYPSKYWVDVERSENHQAELDLVPAGSRVLEIGAADGHMTQALSKKGCEVTAVEPDEALAASARQFCRRLVVSDAESPDFETQLEGELFDVVLLGDVLEHFKKPEEAIRRLRLHLSPGGCLVVCLPNVAHGAVRLALLQGHFDYRPWGLLDRTHLRFFTMTSLSSMFEEAGYVISDLQRIRRGFFDTEIPIDPATVPGVVLRLLCRDPETATYQFVLRVYPQGPAGPTHARGLASAGPTPFDAQALTSEVLNHYERMGWKALFEGAPDVRRARQLRYRAFLLAPSLRRLSRLCVSFLPHRIVHNLGRLYDRVHRHRGSR
jgi:2-polyprenyl-3-methyl-5-hydroxy-6-metoxy-1,4-benzoquinol methylase